MATDLRDRLGDLASQAPHAVPPTDLWDRGVRRRRLARAGTVAVVLALVALLGVGGWSWRLDHRRIEPVAPQGAPHLPDRFYWQVSPWLHMFDGPPGPLVYVFPAIRNTLTSSHNGLVGVTGSTGTYGFLDLPSDAVLGVGTQLALSPDGRRLAFWTTGTPSGTPNTTLNGGATITGVGVYDTVTGHLWTSRFPTTHGLDPSLLLWSDGATLVISYGQIAGGDGTNDSNTSHAGPTVTWSVGTGHPSVLPPGSVTAWHGNYSVRAARGLVVGPRVGRTWDLLDPRRPEHARVFRLDRASEVLVLSADHRRVVASPAAGEETGALGVAEIPPRSSSSVPAHVRRLPAGADWFRPLAWVDADHVAALRRIVVRNPEFGPHVAGEIDLVDLRSGGHTRLVSEFGAGGSNDSDTWLASSFLGAPVVHASPPPSPMSVRVIAWLGALSVVVAVAAGFLLVLWRLRARRA